MTGDRQRTRRRFLAVGMAAVLGGLAGCSQSEPAGTTTTAVAGTDAATATPTPTDAATATPAGAAVETVDMAGLGCRFMTACHALAHRADIGAGDWVAVHGCGGVGLSAVDVATALGGTVVAVDIDDPKLDLARDLGAVETVNASRKTDVPGAVRNRTDGGADVSVDALGRAETCRNSVESLDLFGQHVQIGPTTTAQGGSSRSRPPSWFARRSGSSAPTGCPPPGTTSSSGW